MICVADATKTDCGAAYPALKGRAKVITSLCDEERS